MKKTFSILIASFLFAPLAVFADITVTPHSYSSGSDVISINGGATDGWMSFFAPTTNSSFVWNLNSILSGSTDYTAVGDLTNQTGTFHILTWNNDLTDYDAASLFGTTYQDMLTYNPSEDITITFNSPSPPPPPPPLSGGIGHMIDVSTSSVENVTGFGMNSMALWSWDNIGKPALGTGLGVLYVLKWYVIALIVLLIILFFAFRYAGFFKH